MNITGTWRRWNLAVVTLSLLLVRSTCFAAAGDVTLMQDGKPAVPGDYKPTDIQSLVMDNGLLKITFGPDANKDFSVTSLVKNGQELCHNLHGVEPRDVDAHRTFYLDSNAGGGHLVTNVVRIVKNSPDLVHIAVIDNRALHLEDHWVMLRGESGVHPYVIIKTQPGGNGGGEMRTMYRFDMNILDTTWTPERTGHQPKYALLQSISERGNMGDETWKLPDGTIYQKYDYSVYYSEAPMWGHYGHGFGAFFIPTSKESYAGGPLRQELAVHQDALILNYIGGGHYSGGGTAAGRNGEKIHGPWYLYFATGANDEAVIADALAAAKAEPKKWPYQWVEEPLYPTKRTTVTGTLKVTHGRSAANAYVILGQPGNAAGGGRGGPARAGAGAGSAATNPAAAAGRGQGGGGRGAAAGGSGQVNDRASAIYTQAGDYIYYVKADENGHFTLPGVRPGTYTLYAWETQGPITGSLAQDGVEVKGDSTDLGDVQWDAIYHPTFLWQVGKADRMADEFKSGSVPRTNQLIYQVPNDLTFTIGKSKEAEDWYFAQHSGGTWTVDFNVDKVPVGNAYLTIAVAGGPGNITAAVNGTDVGSLSYGDDASVRRAANRSGRYGRNEYTFPASLLKPGENKLTLRAPGRGIAAAPTTQQNAGGNTGINGGIMYDTIVMEAD